LELLVGEAAVREPSVGKLVALLAALLDGHLTVHEGGHGVPQALWVEAEGLAGVGLWALVSLFFDPIIQIVRQKALNLLATVQEFAALLNLELTTAAVPTYHLVAELDGRCLDKVSQLLKLAIGALGDRIEKFILLNVVFVLAGVLFAVARQRVIGGVEL
jgi:hypothetical protein